MAQVLSHSSPAASDSFGVDLSLSGSVGLVGAYSRDDLGPASGAAYLFRGLDSSGGVINESATLLASDGESFDRFGTSVSQAGTMGLVGARNNGDGGAAYVFRNLDIASGIVNESAKLTPSDGVIFDAFGETSSLAGSIGIVGALDHSVNGIEETGAAYVFRNLDTVAGTVTESAKLVASDGVENGFFGWTLSLSGTTGLVGALNQLNENGSESGVAYLYRNLDTATGTVTESVKLLASDGLNDDSFGSAVSLSGTMALVGANTNGFDSGSAYFFMNLDTASGIATETVKLRASDGRGDDFFGDAVSLSGTTGVVGATGDDDDGTRSGSAYIFRNLDTLSGLVLESVKLTASNGEAFDWFGHSVSLDGDRFVVSALGADDPSGTVTRAGVAYYGSVNSVTVLDESNTSLTIFGLSFDSREDWIVGQTTSGNEVTLSSGDRASVEESGKGVYIGANSGANNNRLTIAGELEALDVFVGGEGNLGNELVFNATSTKAISSILLFPGNKLCIEGEFETFSLLSSWLGDTDLFVSVNGDAELVTQDNFDSLLEASFDSGAGFTSFTVTPEEIVAVVISEGEDQRSMLLDVEICFNTTVTLGNAPFELISRESGDLVQLSSSVDNSGPQTKVTLSFSGPLTESSGSLIDGNYQLTINGDEVTVNGVALDIDGNGTPGGLFVFGSEALHQFYRLFGDVNQSRRVDVFDLLGFRRTFLLMTGDASFDIEFDSNLDGIINVFDLLRFRQNYLKEMPFTSSRKGKRGKGRG